MSKKKRKYQRYWELLKRDKRIVVQITGEAMTPAKAETAYHKFARGIQKEKYQDIVYKSDNPSASLSSEISYKDFTVTFKLADSALAKLLPESL